MTDAPTHEHGCAFPSATPTAETAEASARIDIEHDALLRVDHLPDILPRNKRGKKISLAAVYRWMQKGRLPFVKIGGTRYTSLRAVQAGAELRACGQGVVNIASPRSRDKAIQSAAAKARAILIGGGHDAQKQP